MLWSNTGVIGVQSNELLSYYNMQKMFVKRLELFYTRSYSKQEWVSPVVHLSWCNAVCGSVARYHGCTSSTIPDRWQFDTEAFSFFNLIIFSLRIIAREEPYKRPAIGLQKSRSGMKIKTCSFLCKRRTFFYCLTYRTKNEYICFVWLRSFFLQQQYRHRLRYALIHGNLGKKIPRYFCSVINWFTLSAE